MLKTSTKTLEGSLAWGLVRIITGGGAGQRMGLRRIAEEQAIAVAGSLCDLVARSRLVALVVHRRSLRVIAEEMRSRSAVASIVLWVCSRQYATCCVRLRLA